MNGPAPAPGPYRPVVVDLETGRVALVCAGCEAATLGARLHWSSAGPVSMFPGAGFVVLCTSCRATLALPALAGSMQDHDAMAAAFKLARLLQMQAGEARPTSVNMLLCWLQGFRAAQAIVQAEADRYQGDDLYGAALRDLLERMDGERKAELREGIEADTWVEGEAAP